MQIHYLVPLLAAIIYIVLLVVMAVNRSWQRQQLYFAYYLGASALWGFSNYLLRANYFPEHNLLLFRIVLFSSFLWVVQLYMFVTSFLNLKPGWGKWFGYVSLSVFTALLVAGIAPSGLTISESMVSPEYSWWLAVYIGPMSVFGIVGLYFLVTRYRRSTDIREKNKILYLILSISMLVAFGYTGLTPLSSKFPISHIGSLLAACFLTFAVLKHELVTINAFLRRALGWASLLAVGVGTYLLVYYVIHRLFNIDINTLSMAIASFSSVIVSIMVYRLRFLFLEMVDQLFHRGTYYYRQVLLGFSRKMGNILDLNELANEMLPAIVKALRTPQVKLLFEDSRSGDYVTRYTYPKGKPGLRNEPVFSGDNPIVTWMEKYNMPIDLKRIEYIPQLKGLWKMEKDDLETSELGLLCPVMSRGELIGILALGKSQSHTYYSSDDMEFLTSIANQAGVIIENARMFEVLKNQQIQMEQLLAHAVFVQEEERERISADLHDSVAQWLAAASYRAQTVYAMIQGTVNEQALNELTTMEDTVDRSLKELRRIVIGLRPPVLDELGLTHALQQGLKELRADGVECRFSKDGEQVRLPSNIEITVYRAVQEAINNIRKHSKASRVSLRLEYLSDRLQVTIRDNGKGFDLSQTMDSAISVGHMGLLGMRQRAEIIGGNLKIKTSEGEGTTITITLPLQTPVEEM